MTDRKKKVIYWLGYLTLIVIGIVAKVKGLLPIVNTTIFLFGLMWVWVGVTVLCKINPHYAQKHARKWQIAYAVGDLGLGVSWVALSLTEFSQRGLPVALVSLPFIVLDAWAYFRNKKET